MIRRERQIHRAELSRVAAAARIEEIADRLAAGAITLRVGEDAVRLAIPRVCKLRIVAAESEHAGRLTIEFVFPQVPRARREPRLLF
jgi:amphi-Trp domain-containing protein